MSDLADLILFGTDDEIRAAASDPSRKKISAQEATDRLMYIAQLGVSVKDFSAALSEVVRRPDR